MTKSLPSPLRGIITPMVTPLLARDSLDHGGLERLVEHLIAGGVHGIFILGTIGEAPSLSQRLRYELIKRVCSLVRDRVPVLVGITDTAFVESVNIARYAAEAGASGLVMAPPYYFPAGQPELLEYLQHIVPLLPLPVFLYNMPSYTKLEFEPETVRAAANMPAVVGLKDSSANMIYLHQLQLLLGSRPDFALLVGPEELLAGALLLGTHGGVCGGSNFWPQLYVDLYNAAVTGDLAGVKKYHALVMRIHSTIYSVGRYRSSVIKGIKCALSCLGICDDFMAEPFHRFRPEHRVLIRQYLEELGLLK
ncbi:MAG: dihydrodipicolinate synthase family protein [Kiritimatiellia bacterium]